jgi:integrase
LSLTAVDIDDVYRHLLRAGGAEGRPLAAGTVHRVHVVSHRALTQAVRWEWVWLNPASAASPPRVPPAEVRPPSPDQVQRLLAHVEDRDPDFGTYLWLAASTRVRRSQLLGLRWGRGRCPPRRDRLRPRLRRGTHRPGAAGHHDPSHYRVAIDKATMHRLLEHRRRADARARSSGVAVADTAFVFSAERDRSVPWLPNRVTKQFIRHLRRCGVGRFRLHDLRHFMATQMLGHGVAIVTVAQRLGHARASTTLNV